MAKLKEKKAARVRTHTKEENKKRRLPLYPALIFTIILTQIPFVVTLIISTFHWNIIYPKDTKFVWFKNFKDVFSDERMRAAIFNSVFLTTTVVLFSTFFGLILAVLLDRKFRGRAIVRTLLITPFLITPVASALMWKHIIFNPLYGILDGFATQISHAFGGTGTVNIDFVSNQPLVAIAVPMIWQWTPFMMLIILAGLQSQATDNCSRIRKPQRQPWQTQWILSPLRSQGRKRFSRPPRQVLALVRPSVHLATARHPECPLLQTTHRYHSLIAFHAIPLLISSSVH